MKKILLIFSISFLLLSCDKDASLDPRPVIVAGQYVRLDITDKFLNLDKLDEVSFGGIITAPGGNIKSFELFVRFTSADGITTGSYNKIPLVIDSFPYQLKITPLILANSLNVPAASFKAGDRFRFLGYSYDINGNVTDYNNLSSVIKQAESSKQAYKFNTTIFNQVNYNITLEGNKYDNYAE